MSYTLTLPLESDRVFWFKQRPLRRPSPLDAVVYDAVILVHSFCPFCYGQRLTSKRNKVITSTISSLFASCFPSTIRRFVVAVIVDASNLATRRGWFAHIFKEVGKGLSPTLTDSYSATPVVFERFMGRVIATLNHPPIGIKDRGSVVSVLNTSASATNPCAVSEQASPILRYVAAVASGFPSVKTVDFPNQSRDCQSAKSLPKNVMLRKWKVVISMLVRHLVLQLRTWCQGGRRSLRLLPIFLRG